MREKSGLSKPDSDLWKKEEASPSLDFNYYREINVNPMA
jgi:hypothetical protein